MKVTVSVIGLLLAGSAVVLSAAAQTPSADGGALATDAGVPMSTEASEPKVEQSGSQPELADSSPENAGAVQNGDLTKGDGASSTNSSSQKIIKQNPFVNISVPLPPLAAIEQPVDYPLTCGSDIKLPPECKAPSYLPSLNMAQFRIAFVVGNSEYVYKRKLFGPKNDATYMAERLRELGFVSMTCQNLTGESLKKALSYFSDCVIPNNSRRPPDVALYYFSGHGSALLGDDFFWGVDIDTRVTDLIKFEKKLQTMAASSSSVDVNKFSDEAKQFRTAREKFIKRTLNISKLVRDFSGDTYFARSTHNIVVMDSCRNALNDKDWMKGTDTSHGWTFTGINAPFGAYIAYATAQDSFAQDASEQNDMSPFTKAVYFSLTLNEDVDIVFRNVRRQLTALNKQRADTDDSEDIPIPWSSSSLSTSLNLCEVGASRVLPVCSVNTSPILVGAKG